MVFEILVVGALQANCYIIGSDKTREAVVIDPGSDEDRIIEELTKKRLNLKYIINTHAHFDHVGGNAQLKKKTGAKIIIHEDDNILLSKLNRQADIFGFSVDPSPPADIMVKDGDKIELSDLSFDVIHTPGHTPGGISLKIDNMVFSGDTLFNQSIGRTDLPGGSFKHIIESVKNRLFTLDDDILVYPGHGSSTTIGIEKKSNPYF